MSRYIHIEINFTGRREYMGNKCTFWYTMNTISRQQAAGIRIFRTKQTCHTTCQCRPPYLLMKLWSYRQSPSKCDSREDWEDDCIFIWFWLSFAQIYFPWTCLPLPVDPGRLHAHEHASCMARSGMQTSVENANTRQRQAHVHLPPLATQHVGFKLGCMHMHRSCVDGQKLNDNWHISWRDYRWLCGHQVCNCYPLYTG
jgi:hypothetical protein